MTDSVKPEVGGNRDRLLDAAASLLEEHPGAELSLRAVCSRVGVQMPTLYHYFGSKRGLIEAVVARGFDRYLGEKEAQGVGDDPIEDIRVGWDRHVAWALGNPAIYALMWEAVPGTPTRAAERALRALCAQTDRAARRGVLSVAADAAAERILAACVGAALFLISREEPDLRVSTDLRDATLAAVTGALGGGRSQGSPRELARALATALRDADVMIAWRPEERALLRRWLDDLAAPATASDPLR